jgi:uncharacterized protein YgiM (DUF1202 family)
MKIKRLVSICLAVGLTLAFSATAFAATPSPASVTAPSTTSITAKTVSPQGLAYNPPTPGWYGYCYVTAEPSLNMRSAPSSTASILFTVPYGELLYVYTCYSNGWSNISYNGNFGYCSSAYLQQYDY